MAIPTGGWELLWFVLIPKFSLYTVLGIVILLIAIFGGRALNFIGSLLENISSGKIGSRSLRISFYIIGIALIWGVSFIQKLAESTEGLILLGGIVLMLIAISVVIADRLPDKEEGGGNGGKKKLKLR